MPNTEYFWRICPKILLFLWYLHQQQNAGVAGTTPGVIWEAKSEALMPLRGRISVLLEEGSYLDFSL